MDDSKKDDQVVSSLSGMNKLYIPEKTKNKYTIVGTDSQILTIALGVDESVEAEPGTMVFLTSGVKGDVRCEGCCGRCCAGESCCDVSFTNHGQGNNIGFVGLTSNFPTSKVVPIDLSSPQVNGAIFTEQGAFIAKYGDVDVGVSFDFNCFRCCCAGSGFIQQKITGTGTVFLASTGTIVQKVLSDGEVIQVDTNNIFAWTSTVDVNLRRSGGIMGMMGGGESVFNTTLTGPGLVLIRSMNEATFKHALADNKMWRR